MYLNTLRTLNLMSPDTDGTSGGATQLSDELPENLRGKYVSVDKFNGTKGALEQQITRYRSEAEKVAGEKTALEGQLTTLSTQLKEFQDKAAGLDDLTQKLTEAQNGLQAQSTLNARLEVALKFPQILDDSTLALVKTSTLEPTQLEEHLGKLATKFAAGTNNQNLSSGQTPPQPKNTQLKPADLMREAEELRIKGDEKGWQSKLAEAWALMDAEKRFAPPQQADAFRA